MRKVLLIVWISVLSICTTAGQNASRVVRIFDDNWRFSLTDNKNASMYSFDDTSWRLLELPHDWSIEGTIGRDAPAGGSGGYYPTGTGWYRKHFTVKKGDLQLNHIILFDGVYMNSDVWINGHHLGSYPFGYNSFWYSLDKYLIAGENILSVRVDNSKQPASRWYSGSGIYRHVWLIKTNKVHIPQWGIYITTPQVTDENALVSSEFRVENSTSSIQKVTVISYVTDNQGFNSAELESAFQIQSGQEVKGKNMINVPSPILWSVETPTLYSLITKVLVNGKIVDEVTTPFGIRSITYDVDKGFFLNGKSLKMNGVCLHHDAGCVGAAVPLRVWERRLEILKEMGCNAIRTSHNPVAPEFLDLCDKMGFLVMDEIFDEWKIGKVPWGYNIYFDEWGVKDVISFVRRDRNHPSVVLWSAGNEIREQPVEGGELVLQKLLEVFHSEDPTRPVTVGCDNIAADGGKARFEFLNSLDIVGYNYVDRWHERRELFFSIDRHEYPGWKMVGTESVSNGGPRGIYSFGNDSARLIPNYNTRMIRTEQLWKFVSVNSYVIGDFMWTGIDYLGEARWPAKSSTSGVIDLCGFPKDGFYFYQSQWTEKPMIHLFPHWNWEGLDGKIIPVLAYSNCDAVELFVNGKSFGEKRLEFPRQGNSGSWNSYATPPVNPTTADLHLSWDVPYEQGTLKAVGKKNGQIVCTEIIETTGKVVGLRLTGERSQLKNDNQDIVHVKVEVVDDKGRNVPVADNLVSYKIAGPAKLLGLENGNPTDPEPYKSGKRKLFNGLGLAIIQAGKIPGKVTLTASSEGMKDVSIEILVIK